MTLSHSLWRTYDFTSLLEEACSLQLEVEGTLPPGLDGTVYHIGPGRFEIDGHPVAHWFDGFAMAASCVLSGGQARYTNRFLASAYYRQALETTRVPAGGVGSLSHHGAFHGSMDNTDMNLLNWQGTLEALGDTPKRIVLNPETLATISSGSEIHPRHCLGRASHPVVDPETDERYDLFFCSDNPSGYSVTVTSGKGKLRQLCRVPAARLGYIQSFGVTEHHVIVTEPPFTARLRSPLFRKRPYLYNFVWDAVEGTRITVIDRRTGTLQSALTTHPLYFFDTLNSWEEGTSVIVDIGAYPDPSILNDLAFSPEKDTPGDFPAAQPTRLTIDMARQNVTCIPFKCSAGTSFAIDPRFSMKRYMILFSNSPARRGELATRLCRFNAADNTTLLWSAENCLTGEPVFVPAFPEAPEGNGWLLSFVLDTLQHRSFLLVLHAETMREVARAWLPHVLPFGLRTLFISKGENS